MVILRVPFTVGGLTWTSFFLDTFRLEQLGLFVFSLLKRKENTEMKQNKVENYFSYFIRFENVSYTYRW